MTEMNSEIKAGKPGGNRVRTVKNSTEELRSSAGDMEAAAWEVGIDPKEPLGVFVWVMKRTLVNLAETIESFHDAVGARIEGAAKMGQVEVEKLRLANESARIVILKADRAQMISEGVREEAILKTVDNIGPEVISRLKPWLVVRETAWVRRMMWKRWIGGCVAGAALIGIGMAARAWEDRPYVTAAGRCVTARLQLKSTGHLICDLSELVPEALE